MIEKTDDALQGVNDFLKTLTNRITPNVVLAVAILNGFIIGLVTTGYLGNKSLSVQSLSFLLIIWQLIIICIFSSRYIELTTGYLNKFFICGLFGFIWQWEIFGTIAINFYPELTTITPIMDHGLVVFTLAYLTLQILFGYCFKNNKKHTSKVYSLKEDKVA